jgi:hypothetical protein
MQSLTDTITFLTRALLGPSSNDRPGFNQIGDLHVESIEALARQRLHNCERYIQGVNQNFESYNKRLSIRESISAKRLTILASLFLPLSLVSSLLSMQTRFKNLHLLLYDFLGVFILISSLTILAYSAVRIGYVIKSLPALNPWRALEIAQHHPFARYYYFTAGGLSLLYSLSWAIVLSSFVVGMVLNVTLGLKVLGFGFAGEFALLILFLFGRRMYLYH